MGLALRPEIAHLSVRTNHGGRGKSCVCWMIVDRKREAVARC